MVGESLTVPGPTRAPMLDSVFKKKNKNEGCYHKEKMCRGKFVISVFPEVAP